MVWESPTWILRPPHMWLMLVTSGNRWQRRTSNGRPLWKTRPTFAPQRWVRLHRTTSTSDEECALVFELLCNFSTILYCSHHLLVSTYSASALQRKSNCYRKKCTNSLIQGPFYSVAKWIQSPKSSAGPEFWNSMAAQSMCTIYIQVYIILHLSSSSPKCLNRSMPIQGMASSRTLHLPPPAAAARASERASCWGHIHPHRPTKRTVSCTVLWNSCFWMRTWHGHGMTRVASN